MADLKRPEVHAQPQPCSWAEGARSPCDEPEPGALTGDAGLSPSWASSGGQTPSWQLGSHTCRSRAARKALEKQPRNQLLVIGRRIHYQSWANISVQETGFSLPVTFCVQCPFATSFKVPFTLWKSAENKVLGEQIKGPDNSDEWEKCQKVVLGGDFKIPWKSRKSTLPICLIFSRKFLFLFLCPVFTNQTHADEIAQVWFAPIQKGVIYLKRKTNHWTWFNVSERQASSFSNTLV